MDWQTVEVRDEDGNGFEFIKKGELVMPRMFAKDDPDTRIRKIKEIKVSPDDVFICSYPKTGTHWVFNLVYFLTTNDQLDDMATVPPRLMELAPEDRWEMITASSLRATHFKPDRLPSELLSKGGKVILVCRNPKDSCVSLLHHISKMKSEMKYGDKIAWNRFFEGWISGELPFGQYFDYYNAWEKEVKNNKNLQVLIVHFENLKTDGVNELQRIQEFLGLNHPKERLQQILDRCSLKNMKSDVESGKSFSVLVDDKGKSILYRKGEVGGWKSYFTVAQSEYMDKIIEEKFKDSMFRI